MKIFVPFFSKNQIIVLTDIFFVKIWKFKNDFFGRARFFLVVVMNVRRTDLYGSWRLDMVRIDRYCVRLWLKCYRELMEMLFRAIPIWLDLTRYDSLWPAFFRKVSQGTVDLTFPPVCAYIVLMYTNWKKSQIGRSLRHFAKKGWSNLISGARNLTPKSHISRILGGSGVSLFG